MFIFNKYALKGLGCYNSGIRARSVHVEPIRSYYPYIYSTCVEVTLWILVAKLVVGLINYSGIMAGRTSAQIAEALTVLTNLMARDNDPAREDEKRLERFLKHKPSFFT